MPVRYKKVLSLTLCCNAVSLSCVCVCVPSSSTFSLVNQIQWYLYIVTVYGNSSRHIFSHLRGPNVIMEILFLLFLFFFQTEFQRRDEEFCVVVICLGRRRHFNWPLLGKSDEENQSQFSFVCLLSRWVVIIHFQFLATDISWTIFFSFFLLNTFEKSQFFSLASFFFFFNLWLITKAHTSGGGGRGVAAWLYRDCLSVSRWVGGFCFFCAALLVIFTCVRWSRFSLKTDVSFSL